MVELVDVVAEGLQILVQLLAETSVLRTLTSEAEGDFGRDHGDRAVRLLDLSLESIASLADLVESERHTVVVLDAASSESVGE